MVGARMAAIVCPLAGHFLWQGPPAVAHERRDQPMRRAELIPQACFMTMSLAFALGLFAQIGLFAHLIARIGPDFGPGLAAAAISLITLCAVAGRTLLGWLLGDRDRRIAAAANLMMQAVGSLLLAPGHDFAAADGRLRAVRAGRWQPDFRAAADRAARIS